MAGERIRPSVGPASESMRSNGRWFRILTVGKACGRLVERIALALGDHHLVVTHAPAHAGGVDGRVAAADDDQLAGGFSALAQGLCGL